MALKTHPAQADTVRDPLMALNLLSNHPKKRLQDTQAPQQPAYLGIHKLQRHSQDTSARPNPVEHNSPTLLKPAPMTCTWRTPSDIIPMPQLHYEAGHYMARQVLCPYSPNNQETR
ncbi:Hypothetical predicted protein [Pelobates cultripes]|uniref:Uncharacterized protein n=1 Tax=Pelobates cultripes TaxID=61616 RepID=A0AAD1TBI9_PELCU|nr:Hypothetical predicted protein [Pelobates cultripes]